MLRYFSLARWWRNRSRLLPEASRRLRYTWARVSSGRIPLTRNMSRIHALRQRHPGSKAVIIGNGPSLRVTDLDRLTNVVTFAANKIYMAFDQTTWRPTYYNVEDPLVIQQNCERINALKGFPKLLNRHDGRSWQIDEWTILYDLIVLPEARFPSFSANPQAGLCCGYTVCLSSLQWAWYMGITEIYLIGVDFNFTVPKADATGTILSKGEDNHFMKGYRAPGEKWMLPKLEQQEAAFTFARDWLNTRGVKVFNATRGGKLEVFPRVEFDRIF